MRKPKIFITGGHLTPAVAMIDLLLQKKWQIWYIGRLYPQEEDQSISVEYQTLKKYKNKVELLLITTGKLQRYLSLKSLISLLKIPIGFGQSFYWLIKYRPDIILSFGGYVALPVALNAWFLRIPVVTHEQTRSPGLANRLIAKLASKICLTWSETKNFFPNHKTVITGLPLRQKIWVEKDKLPVKLDKPLIYISGGSLGSHFLNKLFLPIIPKLLNYFSIIHQCGRTKKYNDYFKLLKIKNNLPPHLRDNYLPIPYVEVDYLGWLYQHTVFAVSRAGANTVYELTTLSIPAIFVPIPWSAGNEQFLNAEFLAKNKAALIIDQTKINSELLYQKIFDFAQNVDYYRNQVKKLQPLIIKDGVNRLFTILKEELNNFNEKNQSFN